MGNNYNMPNTDKIRDVKDEDNNKKKKHPDVKGFMEMAEELNPDDFE